MQVTRQGSATPLFLRPGSQVARQESAKLLYRGSIPLLALHFYLARVVKLVYTTDLKSVGGNLVGVRFSPRAHQKS